MEVIGIDVGFGFTKACMGNERVIFKSIIGESSEIQFFSNIAENSETSNLHISIDNKSYYIGEFAEIQSNVRQFTLDQDKLLNEFLKLLALTAIGTSIKEENATVNVVSGLPVIYLRKYHRKFSEILSGKHRITFHSMDGKKVTKNIHINKVKMMPQPIGSIFNLLMDEEGKIATQDLIKKKVGIIDIGFRTTDVTIFDKLQYI